MNITIKTIKGEQFTVTVEPAETVADIKTKISNVREDHTPDRLKLIHAGKVLKDTTAVSEIGIEEGAFIVMMLSGKKAAPAAPPAPAPVAAPAPAPVASTPAPAVASTPAAPAQGTAPTGTQASPNATSPMVSAGASTPSATPSAPAADPAKVAMLVAMGFPESEAGAALNAAMGNVDMAAEFLMSGIPPGVAAAAQARAAGGAPATAPAPAPASTGPAALEAFRQHPQFNQLKRLVQTNPAAISQVMDAIGRQNPALLEAIHANHDAFVAMMNEPIDATPPAPPTAPGAPPAMTGMPGMPGAGGGQQVQIAQLLQLMAALPEEQRGQMAASMGLPPEQLNMMMQMMQHMPPEQLQQMLQGMGGGGGGGALPPGAQVIRLTPEERAAVNRLMELGFGEQAAVQAYIACDKDESLAANFLFEGGFGGDEDGGMMGGFEGDDHDHDEGEGGDGGGDF